MVAFPRHGRGHGTSISYICVFSCNYLIPFRLMTPFVHTCTFLVLPVSCSLGDSVSSQGVVNLLDDFEGFETYLLHISN